MGISNGTYDDDGILIDEEDEGDYDADEDER